MPGERPRRAPPPAATRDLHPSQGAGGLGRPSHPPHEYKPPSSRTTQAREPLKAHPGQAREVEPLAPLLRSRPPHGPLGKGDSPHTPPVRSHPGAQVWLAGRADGSPPQLYGLSIASPTAKLDLDKTPEGQPLEAPQDSQAEACHRPSFLGAKALPTPEELCSPKCFQEAPSSFTSSNYTSPSATPGPRQAPPNSGTSPTTRATLPELQASGARSWPPAAEDNFPGANFGVPPTEPEPFPEGSRPGSPRGSPFPYPLQAQAPHKDEVGQGYANGVLAFSFHQSPEGWPEVAMATGPAYPLPPAPSPLRCYPSQPGSLEAPSSGGHALSLPGTAPPAPRPFPNSLHKSLTKVFPKGPPSAHEGPGSSRAPPNPGPQRHFPGQVYRANGVGSTEPGTGDTELATPRPLPARLPQLWDSTAAPYPEPTLGPPPTASAAFFDSPSQRLCLPQSPPVPWSSVLPSPRPSPHQMEVPSRLPFPGGATEWQEGSRGALSAASQAAGPGETLVAVRTSPGQTSGSPGLFPYSGLKDPGTQPLFFGGTQPQASPQGTPGLPTPRVMGVSPSESPLPSPATNTTGSSTCSSLSPLSSSPANPSSEDSQLPVPLGPSDFFFPAPCPQETGSPFQSPEPPPTGPAHFPCSSDGLGSKGALEFPGSEDHGAGGDRLHSLTQDPAAYAAHHFPLSSASLDQLDVLLTCRQCDRNYSSLAAFLEHRQFCGLLVTRHGPPGHPAPTAALKVPAPTNPDLLGHGQTVPFLLPGDMQVDSKDDTLQTSFLPGLATPPFPLPASDLDLEDNAKLDDAKLDSLITEALNGMQDPSDSPEIDSSFIDVFAEEDPPGPRGPGTGQPPSTQAGTSPEHHAQPLPPAGGATPQPQDPCPGDRDCPARSRPNTPSLGPVPTETTVPSLGRQPRRGKQFKFFRKELDAALRTKAPYRTPCPGPRRRSRGAQQPPSQSRDLRSQSKGHTGPGKRVSRALSLPTEPGSAKHLRLPPKKDPRKRRARRGGSWSKELIHKIVLQKNKLYRPQGPRRPLQGRLGAYDCASESEEESSGPRGPGRRGCSHHGRRQRHLGRKSKEEDVAQGPSEVGRPESSKDRGSPAPGQLHSPSHSLDREPRCTGHPTEAPKDTPQVPAGTAIPEESHPSLDLHQAVQKPRAAEELPPNPTKLREVPTWEGGSPRPPTPEPPPPSRGDTRSPGKHQPLGSHPNVLPSGSVPRQGTSNCTELCRSHVGEDAPAHRAGNSQVPVTNPTKEACPKPGILCFRNSDLGCSPAHFNRDSVGVPATKKGLQSNRSAPNKLFLGPPDPAVDTLPASSSYLGQDHVDTLEPKPPKNPPYAAETDPGRAQSPLTLESTSLFVGLPEDGFDPPLYDSLSPQRTTPVMLACADSLPRKPLIEPLFPPFLLLEDVSPMLPSQFPDLSGPKASHKKCPHEETAPPSPAPVPRKGNEYSAAFTSNLSEDELEIKRLISELESQLQRREGTQVASGDPGKATCAASPMPAHLPGPRESSPHREAIGPAVSPRKGVLRSPQRERPCPAMCRPFPPPDPHKDPVSGALFGSMEHSLQVLMAQKSRGCKTNGDTKVSPRVCLPNPSKQPEAPLEARGLEHGPNCDLLLPRSDKSARTQDSGGSPTPLSWEQSAGQPPEPQDAEGPCPGHPTSPAPKQVFWSAGDASLDVILPPAASHSHTSKAPAPQGSGPLQPLAEGSSLQGQEAQYHPGPHANPASSPSHPLQVQGARAEGEDSVQVLQGPPPADAQNPSLGEDRVTGSSPGGVQDTATSTVPKADGHLGSPGHPEKPKGQGKASHCLPEAWRSLGVPGNSAKANAFPRMPRPARATAGLQGGSRALGLPEQVKPSPSPQGPLGTAAHTQQGAEDRGPGEMASLAPPTKSLATPTPCSLQHGPQEDPPSMPLGVASWTQAPEGARTECPPADPPSLMTSLYAPEEIPPSSSPEDWPALSDVPAPTRDQEGSSSSELRTPEDFRKGGPGSSPAHATPPCPGGPVSPRKIIKEHDTQTGPTEHEAKVIGELRVLDPSISQDPSLHPPRLLSCLGYQDSHSTLAKPTELTTAGSTEPGPSLCLEREMRAISEGQEDAETPGARHSSVINMPIASPQGLTTTCSPQAASLNNTASDFGSNSPKSYIGVPQQTRQMDSLRPQDPKQKPHEPTEKGKGRAPAGPPILCITCEICSASFRSGPGLSRHKARKHRPHGGATPGCRAPGKKSRRAPSKERPSHALVHPSQSTGPPAPQGSTALEETPGPEMGEGAERGPETPGHPLNKQPHPPGLTERVRPPVVKSRRPDPPEANKLHPRQTEKRIGQRRSREPRATPSTTTALKPQENMGKGQARRPRGKHGPCDPASAMADRRSSKLSAATDCSPDGQQGADGRPGLLEDTASNTSLGALHAEDTTAQKSPGGGRSPRGKTEEASPGELPEEQKGALARGLWEHTVASPLGKDSSQAAAAEAAEDCQGAKGRPGHSTRVGMSSSETRSVVPSCLQGLLDAPEAQHRDPEAPSPGRPDPSSVLDDDMSFAQLFPPGGRLAQEKNPRVYGKRCKRPQRPPPTKPLGQAVGDPPTSARLPTDLSDSGSLCLSCEDLWGNKAMELPEPWLLDGPLSNSPPGLDLWVPEASRGADSADKTSPCNSENNQLKTIPELHRVPAAWRGLGLRVPLHQAPSPPGDVSPEPPNLEREGYEEGLPGNTQDLEMLRTALEAQELCFPGPCEDLARVLSTSDLDLQEEAAGPGQVPGRERPAPGRRASFKCRVCFRRFHGLGELDLHRLAHSAAPPPTCYMCVERRFSSRQLLLEHLQEKHVQGQGGAWACGMCLKEVADVWMYNQHLREHAALFARRGQARRDRDELPAGSGDEGFSAGRATPHREVGRAGGRDGEVAPRDGVWTPSRASGGDSPATPGPCPEPRPHGELPLRAGPVHADCKDPSRDCHHCGKRFPKPFKLQRHLAVHSPQRVYLCPRCPRVYPAHRELRAHLGGAHGAGPEARDVAPTPLFACERCADVARVTRRAFACSACNYTFARREQLDRHREKHRRACPRPCALRGVRRPGVLEGALPPKRRRVAGPGTDGPTCPGSPPLPWLCPQAAPGTAQAQEKLEDPAGHLDPPSAGPDLPPPALSPLPVDQAEGREGRKSDRALKTPEDGASPGSPGPRRKQGPRLVSGKRETPGGRGRCAPERSPGEPSLPLKDKEVSPCHVVPEERTEGPSHEGNATKLGACRTTPKPRPAATTPSRAPRLPGELRKHTLMGSLAPGALAHSPEDRMKPNTPKARSRPSSQGSRGTRPDAKPAGGSQPQLASGQLQSETATTPAKPSGPGQSPTPYPRPPRAQARGCSRGPQACPGPQEKAEGSKKRRKGPGPARRESTGSSGRVPSAPDRPPRAPRKQATPSRVLPAKPRPTGQIGKARPQPWEPRKGELSPGRRRELLGKAFPQARRGRSVPSTRPAESQDRRTAESQSNLLSQLFGQRLTSFKIPLKKDTAE